MGIDMLELADVNKRYRGGRTNAVDGLSFSLEGGEVMGLIGENGAGKSTTVSMIATLLRPDSGKILFCGEDIVRHPGKIRSRLGYVPQNIALYENLTGEDNLRFWAKAYRVKKADYPERRRKVCEIIGFTGEMLDKKTASYSGGMKRRLNIAAALLHRPELVIMDEPTAGIDISSRNMIMEAVDELRREKAAVLYVGHYMEEIERICTRLCIMKGGKCVLQGSTQDALVKNGKRISLEMLYKEKYI